MITAAQIKAIAGGRARADLVSAIVRGWPNAAAKAKLSSVKRAAHFLAQIMTETGGLTILEESGNYRAARISEIFGVGEHSAAIMPGEARAIAALPLAQRGPVLFNRVYGVGNPKKMREFQNTGPNDGWLYRGGGMMQATGKSNYAEIQRKTGLPVVAHPELLHQPDSAFMAAYLEWIQDGRCNAAADRDDVVAVRRIINGGTNGLAECRAFLARAKKVLAGYSVDQPAAILAEPELDADPTPGAAAHDAAAGDVPAADAGLGALPAHLAPREDFDLPDGVVVTGDPQIFIVQYRLQKMNFGPTKLDGKWGGVTGGSIAGFINDRHLQIPAPTSAQMFSAIVDPLKAELRRAEAENFVRPVSEARAAGETHEVAAIAPEVVPVRQNYFAAKWASITTFFAAAVNWASDSISQAWDFFTDHKDVVDDHPGLLSTAWGYVGAVPHWIWIALAGVGLTFVAVNCARAMHQIKTQVQNGVRQ